MPQIVVLPHVELCPDGAVIDADTGKSICDNLLDHGIEIEHACEKSCACTTCHVIIREGFNSLEPSAPIEHVWSEEETARGWAAFEAARRLWCIEKNYDPAALPLAA